MRWSLATWNVNSISVRRDAVSNWLARYAPDVLGLQEIKTVEEKFPFQVFEDAGYRCEVFGQKTYNGVALLSREPLEDVSSGLEELDGDDQARFIEGRFHDTTILNVYVPNGKEVGSDKYEYKLEWLDALAARLENYDPDQQLAIVGDFNIAPDDRDLYEGREPERILASTAEREALQRLFDWGLVDLHREFHDRAGEFSWWDYRAGAFRRNRGMRIDLILCTPALARRAQSCVIDVEPRREDKPSDHVPVVATFA